MIIGGGEKACTYIQPAKFGYNGDASSPQLDELAGGIALAYTASSVQTMVNVTGGGYITFASFEANTTSSSSTHKITIDGVVVLDDSRSSNISNALMIAVGAVFRQSGAKAVSQSTVRFNSSLLIECSCNVDAKYVIAYYLT